MALTNAKRSKAGWALLSLVGGLLLAMSQRFRGRIGDRRAR